MANVYGLISYQIQDATMEVTSMDVPFINTTGLLADILAFIAALSPKVDAVIDGQILRIRLSIGVPLPGSLKVVPVANSDNEKTALFSLFTASASGADPVMGLDVPSAASSIFSGNAVNLANADVAAFLLALGTLSSTTRIATRSGDNVEAQVPKSAFKTFRKHRKALRRA